MGRTPKFPPLPPKEGSQEVAVIPMPPRVQKEALEARKRDVALVSRQHLDDHFDDTIKRIFELPDKFVDLKGTTSIDPLKLKADMIKWLAERGYGKSPQVVKLETDTGTPDAILNEIAARKTALIQQLEAQRLRDEAIDATVVEGEGGKA
jgi:hypothetical protein